MTQHPDPNDQLLPTDSAAGLAQLEKVAAGRFNGPSVNDLNALETCYELALKSMDSPDTPYMELEGVCEDLRVGVRAMLKAVRQARINILRKQVQAFARIDG